MTQADLIVNFDSKPDAEGHILNLTADLDVEWGDWLVADFQQAVTGVEPQWFDEESFLACASVEGRNCSLPFVFRRTSGKNFR